MNNASFIGNLCANAVQRQSKDGKLFITFDIAVNEGKDRPTTFVRCLRHGDNANLLPYLEKGKKLYVRGHVTASAFINKENKAQGVLNLNVYELEMIWPQSKANAPQQPTQQQFAQQPQVQPRQTTTATKRNENRNAEQATDVNDLPF